MENRLLNLNLNPHLTDTLKTLNPQYKDQLKTLNPHLTDPFKILKPKYKDLLKTLNSHLTNSFKSRHYLDSLWFLL